MTSILYRLYVLTHILEDCLIVTGTIVSYIGEYL